MDKQVIGKTFKRIGLAVSKHSPEILTGIGIAGMVTTTIFAVRATPKALQLIEEKKKTENVDTLKPIDTVKTCWKCYIPSAVIGTASVVCLIGASSVNAKRISALTAAYKLSETALTEYQEAVVKSIGEAKEKDVREQVSKTRVEKTPVANKEAFISGDGETLFLEPLSQRYFKSERVEIERIVNAINKQMIGDMFGYAAVSDFYDEIGLSHTDISDKIGWNVSRDLLEIDFHPATTDNGKLCYALYYVTPPTWDYTK